MDIKKINIHISTLIVILMVVGYQFLTTLLLPVSADMDDISQQITIPYRAFTLILYLIVLFLNFKYKGEDFPLELKLYLFFWSILVLRIFYDTELRTDVHLNDTSQLWLYIVGIIIPLMFALIKTYQYINFEISLFFIFSMAAIVLIITLFSNQTLFIGDIDEGRQDANIALNTITFGHLGATAALLGLYIWIKYKLHFSVRLLIILITLLGIYSMLRAGSRGPFISFFGVLFVWYVANKKNFLKVFFVIVVSIVIVLIFINQLLDLVGYFSPIMEDRLRASIFEGDTSERNPLYEAAINHFLDNPFLGKQFAIFEQVGLYDGNGTFIYSHNIILDALMGLGLLGGGILIYVIAVAMRIIFKNIKHRESNYWISLILLQVLISNMFSGAIYYDPLLSGLLVIHLLLYKNYQYQTLFENENN
jgi:O-antigen ligase